jgi:hypothetical protein
LVRSETFPLFGSLRGVGAFTSLASVIGLAALRSAPGANSAEQLSELVVYSVGLFGLLLILWRNDFVVDRSGSRYIHRTGRLGLKVVQGPISDIEAVVLAKDEAAIGEVGDRGFQKHQWYTVELAWRDDQRHWMMLWIAGADARASIGRGCDFVRVRRLAAQLAQKMNVPLIEVQDEKLPGKSCRMV